MKKLDNKEHYPTAAVWSVGTTLPSTLTALTMDFSPSNINRYDNASALEKDKCRTGDVVKISRIQLQGVVNEPTVVGNTYRIMMVRWANNDFLDIDPNSILQDNALGCAAHSLHHIDTPYQILMDKRACIGSTAGSFPIQKFSFDKKFKSPLTVAYDTQAQTGLVADTAKGLIRIYVCCNSGTSCTVKFTYRVTFTDA